ncbi:MAG: flagellar protein [Lachnospiraceae bacterium]|nr:flagellar protein [Lachnospiraceae bacterium]
MNQISKNFSSIEQIRGQYLNTENEVKKTEVSADESFVEVLKKASYENQPLKFSKHASMRLESRNISLSKEQSDRLNEGVTKASEKGINDSLVIVDSMAFIVNVPNKTVVTAMDQTGTDDNIFTNIDGAVII